MSNGNFLKIRVGENEFVLTKDLVLSKIKVRIELGVVMMNFRILCLLTVSTETCIYTAVISCLVEQSDIIIHFIFK